MTTGKKIKTAMDEREKKDGELVSAVGDGLDQTVYGGAGNQQ